MVVVLEVAERLMEDDETRARRTRFCTGGED